jgi:hypothetical protein
MPLLPRRFVGRPKRAVQVATLEDETAAARDCPSGRNRQVGQSQGRTLKTTPDRLKFLPGLTWDGLGPDRTIRLLFYKLNLPSQPRSYDYGCNKSS